MRAYEKRDRALPTGNPDIAGLCQALSDRGKELGFLEADQRQEKPPRLNELQR